MKFNYKIEINLYIEHRFYIVSRNLELIHIFIGRRSKQNIHKIGHDVGVFLRRNVFLYYFVEQVILYAMYVLQSTVQTLKIHPAQVWDVIANVKRTCQYKGFFYH